MSLGDLFGGFQIGAFAAPLVERVAGVVSSFHAAASAA
jgi:hypothetical protein